MKRNILFLTFAGALCIIFLSFSLRSKLTRANSKTFIVGTVSNYAPWVSTNQDNELEGFDVDVIKAVSQEMGRPLILQDLGSMSSLLLALEQGKIDAIIWGMSITLDRLKKITMVRYQGELVTSYPLIFWENIPPSVKSIDDMSGKTVCVEPASSQDNILSNYTKINKLATEKVDDALLNIRYTKADAALVEPAIAKKFLAKYPQIKILPVPLADKDQVQGVGICIKKNNNKLTIEVKNAVEALAQNGVLQTYETKWGIA